MKQVIIKSIDESIKNAVFLYDGELHDNDILLESFIKKQKGSPKNKADTSETKPIQASVFIQCVGFKVIMQTHFN